MISHTAIPESSTDPNAEADKAVIYSKDVAGVTQLFCRSSAGTIYQLTPTSGTPLAPGTVAVVRTGNAVSKNLTTEGTLDWFALITASTQLRSATQVNWKILGLGSFMTFEGFGRGQTQSVAAFTSTQTTALTDSVAGTTVDPVLNANTQGYSINTVNATVNYGYCFEVPSAKDGSSRICRINLANQNSIARVTAKMDDGFSTTIDLDSGNGATLSSEVKFTYSGGNSLRVSVVQISHYALSPRRLDFQNMTLALV